MPEDLDQFIDEHVANSGPLMDAFRAKLRSILKGPVLQRWTADFSLTHGAATSLGCLFASDNWRRSTKTLRHAVPRAMMELERTGALTKFRHMRQTEEGR
jgi:hypothetical protein